MAVVTVNATDVLNGEDKTTIEAIALGVAYSKAIIDKLSKQKTTITPPTDADYTISADENLYGYLNLADGSWTATHNITLDNVIRSVIIDNSNGTYIATVKTAAGTGIPVGAGEISILYNDGTNVVEDKRFYSKTQSDALLALKANLAGANFTGRVGFKKSADVASATALPIPVNGNYADVTGTTTVTSIATTSNIGTILKYHFDGILTLTHHATNLILPSGANITTAAGDEAEFIEYASGQYRCTNYTKADGTAVSVGNIIDTSNTDQTKIGSLTIGESISITSWNFVTTTITLTVASHNAKAGDSIYVSGLLSTTNPANGSYTVTSVTSTTIVYTALEPTGTPTVSSATVKYGELNAYGVMNTHNFLHIQDQKANGTDGGSSSAGVQTRTLNTVLDNTINSASLASSQITLPAGRYYIEGYTVNSRGARHKILLENITDTITEVVGSNEYANTTSDGSTKSNMSGLITIVSTKVFELQHYIQAAFATYGLGYAVSSGDVEVYSEIKIWKVG